VEELVPVLAGVFVALCAVSLPARLSRGWYLLTAALLGVAWSVFIGEAARSWAFALFDAGQAVGAAALLQWLARRALPARRLRR
jgi:hypothetical protein